MNDLRAYIWSARHRAGLTQAQLARAAGVSRQFVVRLEQGAPRAELFRVMAVLRALNVTVALSDDPPEPPIRDAISDYFDTLR